VVLLPPESSAGPYSEDPFLPPQSFEDIAGFSAGNFSRNEEIVQAKPYFIIICAALMLVSALLIFLNGNSTWIALFGYFLTPVAVTMALGFDALYQRLSTAKNPWFVTNSSYSKVLRIQVLISYLLMLPHAYTIAANFSAYLAHS